MNREPRIGDIDAAGEARSRPAWVVPAIAGMGGLAFGLLLATTVGTRGPSEVSPTLPPAPTATSPTSVSTVAAATTTTSMPSGRGPTLGELVPGFEGTLYFADPTSSRVGEPVLRWSSEMSQPALLEIGLPFMGLDAGGERLAVLHGRSLDSPYEGGVLTLLGGFSASRSPQFDPNAFLGSGVVGFRWHAVTPGLLAWVEYLGVDRWTLNTADFTVLRPTEPVTVTELDRLVWPLYWDDDVIVLLEADGWDGADDASVQIVSLAPDGRTLGTSPGRFIGRMPTGELVIDEATDGSEQHDVYLTDVALGERLEPAWLPEGSWVRSVVGSPDGERAIIHVERPDGQALLRILEAGASPLECDLPAGVFEAFWSSDSHWIVAHLQYGSARESHLEFLDPETCSAIGVPVPEGTGFLTAVGR